MFLMTQCAPSKHLAAMSASHVIAWVIFFKPPPHCFCFKELIFNGSVCLFCPWKLHGKEGQVLKTVVLRAEFPVGTQGAQPLALFPPVKRGGSKSASADLWRKEED